MNTQEVLNRIEDYISLFTPYMQQECMSHIKKLRKENPKKSYKWIYKALSRKTHKEWSSYGFGLLYTDSYRAQINKYLEEEEAMSESISFSWFYEDAAEDENEDYTALGEEVVEEEEVEEEPAAQVEIQKPEQVWMGEIGDMKGWQPFTEELYTFDPYRYMIKQYPMQNAQAIAWLNANGF